MTRHIEVCSIEVKTKRTMPIVDPTADGNVGTREIVACVLLPESIREEIRLAIRKAGEDITDAHIEVWASV
jgi:hypothetical protein